MSNIYWGEIWLVLLGLFAVLMLGVVAIAQTPKRIDFAKVGLISLVWEERVAANSSKSFVFFAKKGQKLSLSMIDDTNQGSMDLGKLSIEPNADPLEMDIEVTKDFLLSVSNNSNKSSICKRRNFFHGDKRYSCKWLD